MDESTKQEILDYLIESEKELKMKSDGLIKIGEFAMHYRDILTRLFLLKKRRTDEKEKNQKRIPYSKLWNLLKVDVYCSDKKETITLIKYMFEQHFNPKFDSKYLESNLPEGISYLLAIENACRLMADQNDKFYKVVCRLLLILIILMHETDELYKKIDEAEKIADRNSKNQKKSNKKEQRLEALKLHPKYPELFEAINKYRHTGRGKDKSSINKLLNEITGIKNQVTIRCYRNDLIEDYLNSEK